MRFVSEWTLVLCLTGLTLASGYSTKSTCPKECSCSSKLARVSCEGRDLTKLPEGIPVEVTELYLSKNQFTTLAAHSFPELPALHTLSFTNNLIALIEEEAFSNLPQLKYLYLTGNKIVDIQAGVFKGLNRLQKLYLAQNKLTSIPDLSNTQALTYLGVDMNRIESAKVTSTAPLLNFTTLILGQNPIKVLKKDDFEALHMSIVSKISLDHCQMTDVENDTFSPFTNLESLLLSNNNLHISAIQSIISSLSQSKRLSSLELSGSITARLPVEVFQPLQGVPLRTLRLDHCELDVLLNGTFDALTSLEQLFLASSGIHQIESGVLLPLKKLEMLDLENNRLNRFPTQFPESLVSLDLSSNSIDEVPINAFPANSKLTSLTLQNCGFRVLHSNSFTTLTGLQTFDLSANKLAGTSIPKGTFDSMIGLNHLDMSKNNLNEISTNFEMFLGLQNLKVLNMSNNDCGVLDNRIFNPLVNLQVLDLRGNRLGKVLSGDVMGNLFSKLESLQNIILLSNDIPSLPGNVFRGPSKLVNITLNNNRITQWEKDTFSHLNNLTHLNLSGNSISVVNSSSVVGFSARTHLDLSYNPFSCWCDLVWFRDWINITIVNLENIASYHCSSPQQMTRLSLLQFDPETIHDKCNPPFLKWALIASACVSVVLIVLFIIIYRYRWKILLFFYRHCRCRTRRVGERQPLLGLPGEEKNFRVTILAGPDTQSEDWVSEQLMVKLEGLGPVCTEANERLPGEGLFYFSDKLTAAVNSSPLILFVYSTDFMNDGQRTFQTELVCNLLDEFRAETLARGEAGAAKRLVPVLFLDDHAKEAKLRHEVAKRLRHRYKESDLLEWRCDEQDAQNVFWSVIQNICESL